MIQGLRRIMILPQVLSKRERECAVGFVEDGHSRREAARVFKTAPSTTVRIVRRSNVNRQLVGLAISTVRAVHQTRSSPVLIPFQNLVAGRARENELRAQGCHLRALYQRGEKLHALIQPVSFK
jgi:hypothetical protein